MIKDWFIGRKFYCVIGLGGVHPEESPKARFLGKLFTYLLLLLAIALLFEWQLQQVGYQDLHTWWIFNWVIWGCFFGVFITLLLMVRRNQRFVRENWLLLLVILMGIPFLVNYMSGMEIIRSFRPLLAVVLMVPALGLLFRFFVDGRLATTLLAALIIVVFFGVLVAGVDPNIRNWWDGIWWALATVSTVGYGDIVPVSFLGRMIGGILVILGLGVFVVITANFLALILREEVKGVRREQYEVESILKEMRVLRDTQRQILQQLTALKDRLDRLN